MNTITTTKALAAFCARAAKAPFVTLDTEFLRERTYYARLCLVQMAIPGDDEADAVIVDALAEGLSLDPMYELMRNKDVVKVLHAARQDLEIFFVQGGVIPAPLFDTQVAAMVCGFGEQVGYDTLVRRIAKASVDKSSRFTDWSRRPLSQGQLSYALADVTHLREIYTTLDAGIRKARRQAWVEEEMAILKDPATYVVEPADAWQRIKTRTAQPRFLAIVRELARFREEHARDANVPRTRVYKDDALLELASMKPRRTEDLSKSRLLLREARRGVIAEGIVAAVARGLEVGADDLPQIEAPRHRENGNQGLSDLLRVLLKAKAEKAGVATKLIASAADLDDIASGTRDSHPLQGWRFDVFGKDAIRLCDGEIALSADGNSVKIVAAGQVSD